MTERNWKTESQYSFESMSSDPDAQRHSHAGLCSFEQNCGAKHAANTFIGKYSSSAPSSIASLSCIHKMEPYSTNPRTPSMNLRVEKFGQSAQPNIYAQKMLTNLNVTKVTSASLYYMPTKLSASSPQQFSRFLIEDRFYKSSKSIGSSSMTHYSNNLKPNIIQFGNETSVVIKREIPSYKLISWLALACFFPLGLLALSKSYKVTSFEASGQKEYAKASSDVARVVSGLAIMIGICMTSIALACCLRKTF